MGESFTVQISANLVKQLADDGAKSSKKTKRSAPRTPRETQRPRTNDSKTAKVTAPLGWPGQPPLFLPVPPASLSANAELDAIRSTVQESERVLEKLHKQEQVMVQEVTQRAKDLHEREFKLPERRAPPCLVQKDACFECYSKHLKDPLKCADVVKNYSDCVRRDRRASSPDK